MSTSIDSLNKILKDQTRQKIILLLNDKQSLSYTELMDTLKVSNTGTLNYHLKIIGELIEKDQAGKYRLTEKGKVAVQFLTVFPEQDNAVEVKKKWWRRYWIAAIVLPMAWLLIMLYLFASGGLDSYRLAQSIFAFAGAMLMTYVFYRIVRPLNKTRDKEQPRTIQDVLVTGKEPADVAEAVRNWVVEEKIVIENQREGFIRGRIGVPSGLGLTAPKYFEVSWKPEQSGVLVHTEGWISLYDLSERDFSPTAFAGRLPRRKGWAVMEHLWTKLHDLSKPA
jgi:DNA-binding transcriptional ArsR family regulator